MLSIPRAGSSGTPLSRCTLSEPDAAMQVFLEGIYGATGLKDYNVRGYQIPKPKQ